MPVKMNPIEPSAGDAILVGDPRRAFSLAQELTVQPRMSHQARGLWGYRGETERGRQLTVQSTGSGGPAAVPIIGDLADQGASRLIRLGTCVAADPAIKAGTILVVEKAIPMDGASGTIAPGASACLPNPDLLEALREVGQAATISSHDLVARFDLLGEKSPEAPGASARDLQTATVLAMAHRLKIPAAAIVVVAEDESGARLDEEQLTEIFGKVGRSVIAALPAPVGQQSKPKSKPEVEV